ncbi:PepSY domain-containing protein [Blastococcus brunescens]|uniref:PepSY domain-containing protein n=1 Tax=Blastococcus brunescens TaxID=1564165 RepID=A0ABZ1B543_9ACTN|nr:PepSY domain-containing protein [Blastococcus sp. BMG 8361]WRL65906.1 PepSY domain-containing protein [Blastococcus sp. BMG 8361]
MRSRKRATVITAATALGLAAAGGVALATGGSGDDLPGTITVQESALPEDDAAEQAALAELASVDEAAAGAAAVEAVGGGEAAWSELEDEDGFVVWEVAVRADDGSIHEVTVDAGDASVLGTERDDDEDELRQAGTVTVDESTLPENDAAEQAALAELASVDEAAAGTAAIEAVGGGEVAWSHLEEENGFVVWEVGVRAADGSFHEVTVDAGDASVLGTDRDDDDDDGDDD